MVNYGDLISTNTGTDHIYIHSGLSSVITGSFACPGGTTRGICIDTNGNLITADNTTDHIFIHSGVSSSIIGSFSAPAGNVLGIGLDLSGNLISADNTSFNHRYYFHSGISSVLTGSYDSPRGNGYSVGGLFVDSSGNLWTITSYDLNLIDKHNGLTSSLIGNISTNSSPLGACIDNNGNAIYTVSNRIYILSGLSATETGSIYGPGSNTSTFGVAVYNYQSVPATGGTGRVKSITLIIQGDI